MPPIVMPIPIAVRIVMVVPVLRNKTGQRTELVLSDPIRAYLIAKNDHDAHGMLACFR